MKSFATIVLVAATATMASAQVTYNSTTGVFTCPATSPNGAFCASDSLAGNIIIRCVNGTGQPGNCNDNLAGEFPFGVNYSPCWETSDTSGDAACSKNCIVYGGSGNFNGTFTLPDCTAVSSSTSSSSSSSSSTSSVSSSTTTTTSVSSSSTASTTSASGSVTTTTSAAPTSTTTVTSTSTTPSSAPSSAASSTSASSPPSNVTVSIVGTGGSVPTVTPFGPTTTSPPPFTGAAVTNSASILAVLGLVVAYFL